MNVLQYQGEVVMKLGLWQRCSEMENDFQSVISSPVMQAVNEGTYCLLCDSKEAAYFTNFKTIARQSAEHKVYDPERPSRT